MRVELTGRHVEHIPALRQVIDRKLARVERMLNDSAVSAQVVLRQEKRGCRADITVHARGENFLHGVGSSATWESSVSRAVDKVVQQAHAIKGRWQNRRKRPGRIGRAPTAEGLPTRRRRLSPPRIAAISNRPVKAMSVAAAARVLDADSDGMVIFRDTGTLALSVLFRRPDGELALVATDA
jgi:ribosomal subunit interface protein